MRAVGATALMTLNKYVHIYYIILQSIIYNAIYHNFITITYTQNDLVRVESNPSQTTFRPLNEDMLNSFVTLPSR